MWLTVLCVWRLKVAKDLGFIAELLLHLVCKMEQKGVSYLWVIYCMQNLKLVSIFDALEEKKDLWEGKERIICSVHSVLQHLSATAAMTNPRWNELEGGHEGYSNFKWRGKIVFIHIHTDTQISTCVYTEMALWGLECGRLNSIKLPAAVKRKKKLHFHIYLWIFWLNKLQIE